MDLKANLRFTRCGCCVEDDNQAGFHSVHSVLRTTIPCPGDAELATVGDFEAQVRRTDRRPAGDELRIAAFGVIGELGSLISEVKKQAREGAGYRSFAPSVTEETGDLLWYIAALASSIGSSFSQVLSLALRVDISITTSLDDVDALAKEKIPPDVEPWLQLASVSGDIAKAIDDKAAPKDLEAPLSRMLGLLIAALANSSTTLSTAASFNMNKSQSRFPDEHLPLALYDERTTKTGLEIPRDERLLQYFAVEFDEIMVRDRHYVVQKVFTLKVGDPLTDNIAEPDDYRFHDVFHLAYAAVLGWSPVLRALFKVKRKSIPELDENQDGARAILIEEGISTYIFNRSKEHLFEGASSVDYAVLKSIAEFVQGYEVDDQPFWAWEKAILLGYEMFRQLKEHRRGRITVDLQNRSLRFEKLGA